MSEWSKDFSALEKRSADPGDCDFAGFIDVRHEDGTEYNSIYMTPMGRWVSEQGPLPDHGKFVEWREAPTPKIGEE